MTDENRTPMEPQKPTDPQNPAEPQRAVPPAPTAAQPGPSAAPPVSGVGGPIAPPHQPLSDASAGATEQPRPKRSVGLGVVVAALAVGALVGGTSGAGVTALLVGSGDGSGSSSESSPQTITVNNSDDVTATTAVAAKASPSVVTLSVTSASSGGSGSGVILSDDGYVLTNTHVVTLDGQASDSSIEVTTYDGRLYRASIVGTDPTVDLAVIKLEDASGLQPITYGDSADLNVGDVAIAIGAPLGLANTVTDGIVSALNRSIQIASSAAPEGGDENQGDSGDNGGQGPFDFWNFGTPGEGRSSTPASTSISIPVIQTDASINPGNSGGALVNADGELIGINVAIASTGSTDASGQSGSIGVGFAIPVDLAQRVAEEIIETGSATHGLLGASVQDATSENGDTAGAVIAEAPVADGAAAAAGLRQGDVVTEFAGYPITGATDLTAQVRAQAGGSEVELTYLRGGEARTVSVTLGTYTG